MWINSLFPTEAVLANLCQASASIIGFPPYHGSSSVVGAFAEISGVRLPGEQVCSVFLVMGKFIQRSSTSMDAQQWAIDFSEFV